MSQAKYSMEDEKQFKDEDLAQCRVHAPQLALCVIFSSRKILQYDDTYKFESQQLTDLMTTVYDVYEPDIATINCGYKTDNKNPRIHWVFDFSAQKFNSNMKEIAANSYSANTKIKLEKHIKHFNEQRLLFSNTQKLAGFSYIQNDIDLYTEMFPNIIPKNIPKNVDFYQIPSELNNDYNKRTASVFIVVPIQNYQSLTQKSQQIDDALQNLIRFTHNSRDSMISFIKAANKPMTNLHYQALQWFELSVKRQKQQILVRSTVTIFHFMWILMRNPDINNSEIMNWFAKYCDYVAKNKKMLSEYKIFECDYQHHNELYLDIYAKKFKKMRFMGKGRKNSRLDCDKIVHDGINQMQNNMLKMRISRNDVRKCADCWMTRKGKVYADDGLFYCRQCWDKYENKDCGVDDGINQIQNKMSEMRISGKKHWKEKPRINHVKKCTECWSTRKGKVYVDGLFYCRQCWNKYEYENKDNEY